MQESMRQDTGVGARRKPVKTIYWQGFTPCGTDETDGPAARIGHVIPNPCGEMHGGPPPEPALGTLALTTVPKRSERLYE